MELFWFLPTHGDGRRLGTTEGARRVDLGYLRQVAQAADELGFRGVLIPTGRSCEDPWIVAAAMVPLTRQLRYLVAVRPGLISPTAAARMTSTLDRLSDGRVLVNVVVGGDRDESRGDGLFLEHDARYAAASEFLDVYRRVLAGEVVSRDEGYARVDGAKLLYPPVQRPHPPLYLGGSSASAHDLAAEHIDVYLSWGEPPAQLVPKLEDVRRRAAARGRTLRLGIRLHVIVRETDAEAWAAAESLIDRLDDESIARAQSAFARMDSEGQRRMSALHGGRRDRLEVSPNLWAGVGLVRGGAGTALVGSPQTVAARMREYEALGIETFVFSGYPHLEEAYRTAELLFPVLGVGRRAVVEGSVTGPFGEMMANQYVPSSRGPATPEGNSHPSAPR